MSQSREHIVASQGLCCDFTAVAPSARDQALEEACDYRGDITLELTDGSQLEGYVFDRRSAGAAAGAGATSGAGGTVRIMLSSTGEKRTLTYAQIAKLTFSGKDTAAGKTFENWVKRYIEKRLAGERASIDSETLD